MANILNIYTATNIFVYSLQMYWFVYISRLAYLPIKRNPAEAGFVYNSISKFNIPI